MESVGLSVHLSRFCLDCTFCTAQPFVTKLGIMVYHHEPECLAERWVRCLQGQGHKEDSFDQNVTVSTIYFEGASLFATKFGLMPVFKATLKVQTSVTVLTNDVF